MTEPEAYHRISGEMLFTIPVEGPETSRDIHRELMKKYGYNYRHPGLGEWQLKGLIRPTESKFLASFDVSVDEDLAALIQKVFSSQWSALEEIHEKVVKELENLIREKSCADRVRVHRWDLGEIRVRLPKNQ